MAVLARAYASQAIGLAAASTPFATAPRALIEAAVTAEERLAAYEVATALLFKRSLRNGAASSQHSIKHRSLADQLMPHAQWIQHKGSFARDQALPIALIPVIWRLQANIGLPDRRARCRDYRR